MSNGILILNKPKNITSHDAVAKLRRLYQTRQIGHTGTLDPMATGVLCILIGRAVKASEYAMDHDKSYRAGLKLGIVTDTGDITGKILSETNEIPSWEEVSAAVFQFRGEMRQVPPMYSAIKVGGRSFATLPERESPWSGKRVRSRFTIFPVPLSAARKGNISLMFPAQREPTFVPFVKISGGIWAVEGHALRLSGRRRELFD